jgi:hypothetical protein
MSRPCFIREVSYDGDRKALTVRFLAGSSTVYYGVPKATGEAVAGLVGDALIYAFDTGIESKFKSLRTG